jgi:succinyl-CoA synthetase beta subunit
MNIHEYQAKQILKSFGVAVQEGIVAETADEAHTAALKLKEQYGSDFVVVKAQIHAGGRGKGSIIGKEQRGVAVAKNADKAKEIAGNLIGGTLVTIQTGPKGKLVSKVLVAQDVYYPGSSEPKEYYMSVMLDRGQSKNIIVYSTEGGMDIEHVAEHTPHLIHKETIDPKVGLQGFQARKIAFNLGCEGEAFKQMVKFVTALYKAYTNSDAAMFEINPVLKTSDDKIIAVDGKVDIDDNALYRHADYAAMRDTAEEDPTEVEAKEFNLNYVKLDGNVGCMVNGAGLAMATMDMIKESGGFPANFLDVGGGANVDRIANAFRIMLSDENVKAVFINIFGGIVRCDKVADGIVQALKTIQVDLPVIVRLDGTRAEEGAETLKNSGMKFLVARNFNDASTQIKSVFN